MKHSFAPGTALAAFAACTLALAGCAPAVDDGDTTEIRFLLGQPDTPEDVAELEADIAEFEAQNPEITVRLDFVPSDNLRTLLQTQLRSGDGPDVFNYDTGPAFAGALAEAGLLYPLTDAYAENEWPIYEFAQERVTFNGEIVGVPNRIEMVGVYYNQDLFAKLGLEQPGSLAELEAVSETILETGVYPFAVADQEGWPGGHQLSVVLSSMVGGEELGAMIRGESSWNSPGVVDSLAILQDYTERGFLNPSPAAVSVENAFALFYSGQAAMLPTGSWAAQEIVDTAEFSVGFIPFPAPDGPGIFAGGLGSGMFVNADTEHAAEAIAFIDYNLTEEHGRWAVENTQAIPAFPIDSDGLEVSDLFAQILADASKIAGGSTDFGYNIDVLMSDSFNQAMWNGIQGIYSGQATPEAVAADLEANY